MNDQQSTVAEVRQIVEYFVAERDWHQFHTPKNLAMALAIEAAELMEHFQWLTTEESLAIANKPAELAAVAEELADVVSYACAMANAPGSRHFDGRPRQDGQERRQVSGRREPREV